MKYLRSLPEYVPDTQNTLEYPLARRNALASAGIPWNMSIASTASIGIQTTHETLSEGIIT